MQNWLMTLTAVLALLPLAGSAQESDKDVAAKPTQKTVVTTRKVDTAATVAATAETSTVDSVAEDLQKIVVLCATEPTSDNFQEEWRSYVGTHYRRGQDVDEMIDDVLSRAAAYRANGTAPRKTRTSPSDAATRKRMHDTAMAAIRNMK